jgi:hypothetical protein
MTEAEVEAETEPINVLYVCPVCRDLMVMPRLFSCGHSVCSPCHFRLDAAAESARRGSWGIVHVRCPMCRRVTSMSAGLRPINTSLNSVIEAAVGKEYTDKVAEFKAQTESTVVAIDFDADLGRIANNNRVTTAIATYHHMLKLLTVAAKKGLASVTIVDEDICREAGKCLDILKILLFKNNVHKISYSSTLKHLTIHLIDVSVRPYYVNADHTVVDPADPADPADAPPPPPPPTRPPGTFR